MPPSQTTDSVFLVRPARFGFNAETAASNAFQNPLIAAADAVQQSAFEEFDAFAATLKAAGVDAYVFDDTPLPHKPDAVFPNNWVSLHADGTVVLYPMHAPNRRTERRQDILDALAKDFEIKRVLDFSGYEAEGRFLEGTGSIIFDHIHRIAYACLSPRTDRALLEEVCEAIGYRAVSFYAHDEAGREIYHTNVMMCLGKRFAVICLECISDAAERARIENLLIETGHEIVAISRAQMRHFAGNMLALHTTAFRKILALSRRAMDSLTPEQRRQLEQYTTLYPLPIPTIEAIGGGSARCMIAEIFLKKKPHPRPLSPDLRLGHSEGEGSGKT